MDICKVSVLIRILTIAILGGCTVNAYSQNSMFIYAGANRMFPNSNNKSGFIGTTGKYGFAGGIGVARSIKNNFLSLELVFASQNFEVKFGPLFFPDDPPTSIGSFYNLSYNIKTVCIVPSFNYALIKGKLYIPMGAGIQKSFSSFDSELIKHDLSTTNHAVEFYQIPMFNISMNSGLYYIFSTTKKISYFSSLKYSYNLIPIKPMFEEYKNINMSMLSVSIGIKI